MLLVIIHCLALHLRFSKSGESRAGHKFSPDYIRLIFSHCHLQSFFFSRVGTTAGKDQKNRAMRGREKLTLLLPITLWKRLGQAVTADLTGWHLSQGLPGHYVLNNLTLPNFSCHLSTKHHTQVHLTLWSDQTWYPYYTILRVKPNMRCDLPFSANPTSHRWEGQGWIYFLLSFLFFFLFMDTPAAYGSSQAKGQIGAAAAGLRHSHSHTGSEPRLRPTPQLTAQR